MTIIPLAITILVLAIIAFCLWFFERMLARKPNRIPGLVMPVGFFIISVFSIVQAAPTVFSQLEEVGGLSGAILTLLVSFLITNIATVWVSIVYHRTRRKMGDAHPWSFHSHKDEQTTEQSEEHIDKNAE
ncbi:MAG: hypothetical protein Q4P20_06260 [Eubacteriales bacterium]|nr:hypothetical protein [Eubacteriales bacterium]